MTEEKIDQLWEQAMMASLQEFPHPAPRRYFAALVLEEAAKVCDGVAYTHQNASMLGPEQNALKCAAAIRALKGAKE